MGKECAGGQTSMTPHIHILLEGQTEEGFVRRLLTPYFASLGLHLNPIIVQTRREDSRITNRGGYIPLARLEQQINRLLGDSSATAVTMMFDFYGMKNAFPDRINLQGTTGSQRVRQLEAIMASAIDNRRFIPYLQLHEFEAFLFVSPSDTADVLGCQNQRMRIARVSQAFTSPEEINDDPITAPSKRISAIDASYDKVFHGPLIASRIGLPML